MPTSSEVRETASEHGRAKKQNNAIVALLSGALPGVVLSFYLPVSWERWLIGLVIGLVWGNAFEYAYHRWMLHRRRSSFAKGHLEHHGTIGAPEEAEQVTLGRSPFHIALRFASNGVFVIVLDLLLGLGLMPGIFVGWTVYRLSDRRRGNPLAHSHGGMAASGPGLCACLPYEPSRHSQYSVQRVFTFVRFPAGK